ncbi:MAG: glycosyltransferase family 4 protein [Chitinophagaceae bacterium]
MDKKKIVHIIPTFELGGVQTGILYSLEELNKVYDYKILAIGKVDNEWLKNMPSSLQNYIVNTGASTLVSGWLKGYRLLKQLKPDFIISSLWKSVGLSATYKLLNKKVYLFGFFHSASSPHFASTFFMKVMSFVQDTSLADSYVTKQFLEKFYKIKNTTIIPYIFTFTKNKGYKNFDPLSVKLSYFGRISQRKGVDRSIEFCSLLKEEGINFIFDIYGEGPIEEYAEKIKKYGLENVVKIKTKLPLHHVIENMQGYDFLLQLSNHEGMALSVVEAMNSGLVPIVTPVGEIKRYSKDGFNAIWLDPEFDANLPILIKKVKKVINDPSIYQFLSSSAAGTFVNYKKYSEAFIEVVNSYLKV